MTSSAADETRAQWDAEQKRSLTSSLLTTLSHTEIIFFRQAVYIFLLLSNAIQQGYCVVRVVLCRNREEFREFSNKSFNSPQPVSLCQRRMTADCIVLIGEPNCENDVECRGCVVEKF